MKSYWQLFVLATHIGHTLAVFSGVYVDNGMDQTVMQRGISRREKVQFERGMLDLLGLPSKPTTTFDKVSLSASAPKFLLNLYKLLDGSRTADDDDDDDNDDDFDLKRTDQRTIIEQSDSIITFTSKNDRKNGTRRGKIKRLRFDVSSAPTEDTLVGAELRLFKERENYADDTNEPNLKVTVFQVIKDLKGEKELTFVDAVNVTSDFEGWLVFNVTSALVSWIAFPYSNHGLDISVRVWRRQSSSSSSSPSKPSYKVLPKEAGIVMVADEYDKSLPFIVAFFKSGGQPPNRSIRQVFAAPRKRCKRATYVPEVSNYYSRTDWRESVWRTRHCQKQSMYVNFKDLKWHNWVIAPDGYAAYYCSGVCDFPLHAFMNATNHAIMQSLVHLIDPSQAPQPSCAPSQLGPMAVLYYKEDKSVIMKRFRNMVVKNCGCH